MKNICTNMTAAGAPRHRRDRVTRRSWVFSFVIGELQRKLANKVACVVPKPQDRAILVKHVFYTDRTCMNTMAISAYTGPPHSLHLIIGG